MTDSQLDFRFRKVFFSVKFNLLVQLIYCALIFLGVFGSYKTQTIWLLVFLVVVFLYQLIGSRRILLEISNQGFRYHTGKLSLISELKYLPIAEIGAIRYVRDTRPWFRLFVRDKIVLQDHKRIAIQTFVLKDWSESRDGWTLSEAIMRCPSLTALIDGRERMSLKSTS